MGLGLGAPIKLMILILNRIDYIYRYSRKYLYLQCLLEIRSFGNRDTGFPLNFLMDIGLTGAPEARERKKPFPIYARKIGEHPIYIALSELADIASRGGQRTHGAPTPPQLLPPRTEEGKRYMRAWRMPSPGLKERCGR